MIARRKLLTGLGALFVAAPAIVRASNLMPVSTRGIGPSFKEGWFVFDERGEITEAMWHHLQREMAAASKPDMILAGGEAMRTLWSFTSDPRFGHDILTT